MGRNGEAGGIRIGFGPPACASFQRREVFARTRHLGTVQLGVGGEPEVGLHLGEVEDEARAEVALKRPFDTVARRFEVGADLLGRRGAHVEHEVEVGGRPDGRQGVADEGAGGHVGDARFAEDREDAGQVPVDLIGGGHRRTSSGTTRRIR